MQKQLAWIEEDGVFVGRYVVGDESATKTTTTKVAKGEIMVLEAADVIKNRTAAYIHWQAKKDGVDQAYSGGLIRPQSIKVRLVIVR